MTPFSPCRLALLAAVATLAAGTGLAQTFPVKMANHQSSYFRGVNPIVLPTYHVTFIVSNQATAVGGGARARNTKVLSGIDETTLRRLTDAAHADLRAQFVAAGFTVVSDETARAMVAANTIPLLPGNALLVDGGGGITVNSSVRQGYVTMGPTAAPALEPYRYGANYLGQIKFNNRIAKGQPENTLALIPHLVLDFANMTASTSSGRRNTASAGGEIVFGLRGVSSGIMTIKVLARDRMFPANIRPEGEYGVPTPFASVQAGGAEVAPLSIAGTSVARGDAVVVDLPAWEALVRSAFRDYNAAIVAAVVKGRG